MTRTSKEGELLGDRYRLDTCLAEAEELALFRATDTKLGATVLIEVVSDPETPPAAGAQHARRSLGSRLDESRIVPELELGETDRASRYAVMPFVNAAPLSARLSREKCLPPSEAAEIAALTAEAIELLQANGIAHTNLHPARVLLTEDSSRLSVKLVRGLSRPRRIDVRGRDEDTKLLMQVHPEVRWFEVGQWVAGPIEYTSPEELRGDALDARADVYSLGALLYRMLAGTALFEGPPERIAAQHISAPPMPIDEARVPGTLAAVLRRALAKNPNHRHSSAIELANALRSAVYKPTTGPPPASVDSVPTEPPPGRAFADGSSSFADSEAPTEPSARNPPLPGTPQPLPPLDRIEKRPVALPPPVRLPEPPPPPFPRPESTATDTQRIVPLNASGSHARIPLPSAPEDEIATPDRAQDYVAPHKPPAPLKPKSKSRRKEPKIVDQTQPATRRRSRVVSVSVVVVLALFVLFLAAGLLKRTPVSPNERASARARVMDR